MIMIVYLYWNAVLLNFVNQQTKEKRMKNKAKHIIVSPIN